MNIVHNIDKIGRTSFGLGPVCEGLAEGQKDLNNNVSIWTLDKASNTGHISESLQRDIRYFPISFPPLGLSISHINKAIRSTKVDVVHQHGIWTAKSIGTTAMVGRGAVSVITPHGSLQQKALETSSWKKKIVSRLYERKNIEVASGIHAVADAEIDGIRRFGITKPIAIIPNGIHRSWLDSTGDGLRFRKKHNIDPGIHILLYLSRITPIKGIPMLLDSLRQLDYSKKWVVVLAGSDEFNYTLEIKKIALSLNLDNIVFTGALFGQDKRDAFAASSFFILPSYSEGSPIVVLEALAASVPVLTTKASSWSELNSYNCGYWTDISSEGITTGLRSVFNLDDSALKEMGSRGRSLVESKYLWENSAKMSIEFYGWLLGEVSAKPSFVLKN